MNEIMNDIVNIAPDITADELNVLTALIAWEMDGTGNYHDAIKNVLVVSMENGRIDEETYWDIIGYINDNRE